MSEPSEPTGPDRLLERGSEYRGGRIFTNSAVMTAGQIIVVLIGMVMTPVTISYVGLALFGLWGIVTTAISYITVIDPGFGGVVARFGAIDRMEGDGRLMARLATLGSLVWLGIGAVFTPIVIVGVTIFARHIHVSGVSEATIRSLFFWGFAFVILDAMANVLNGELGAVGDQWLVTVIDVFGRVAYAAALIVALVSGLGLWSLVMASFIQVAVTWGSTFICIWTRVGFPYGNPRRINGVIFRESLRFGGWAQLTGILDALTYETDTVVIGGFVSATATGIYSTASRLAGLIPFFATSPGATLPAMSAAFGAGEGPCAIARMATKANRLACMLGVALGSMVLGCAPVLLAAWLGHRYYQADLATCLMTIGLLIGIPRQTGGVTIYAMGRVGYGARARVVALVVNLVVTVALVGPLGMPGVLIGTVLAIITSTAYLQIRVNQLLGIGLWESTGRWALPLVLATIPAVILDRIVLELLPASVQSHRIDALGALVILTIVNYVSFIMGLRASRFLGPDDVAYLRTALPGPVARLTRPWMFRLIVRGFTPA